MKANQARYPLSTMARLLKVSRSGFHAWMERPPSAHAVCDTLLLAQIREIHARSRGTYGMPRVHATLLRRGIHVGRERVARLMREAGLRGACRQRFICTTHPRHRVDLRLIWCSGTSVPMRPISYGSPMRRIFLPLPAFTIWLSCSTSQPAHHRLGHG